MADPGYRARIAELARQAADGLRLKGVPQRAVDFDAPPGSPGRRPGDARSEFLANRAMGDWAETLVQTELNRALQGTHRVLKYGNADNIVAGDPAFPAFYDVYQQELRTTGKRPDLLIIPQGNLVQTWGDDLSGRERAELARITPLASAGLEIRSSKFSALRYAEARELEGRQNPRFRGRTVQSFTPKVEDLRVVKRWIDTFGVPHFYLQVFFDSVYVIPFEEILRVAGQEPGSFDVEENRNNQEKPTIHIPVTKGLQLARFTVEPEFRAEKRVTRLFRLDAYVVPTGGEAPMDPALVRRVFGL